MLCTAPMHGHCSLVRMQQLCCALRLCMGIAALRSTSLLVRPWKTILPAFMPPCDASPKGLLSG